MPIFLLQAVTWCVHYLYTRIQLHFIGKNPGFLFQCGTYANCSAMTPAVACKLPNFLLPTRSNVFITRVEWRKRTFSPYQEFLVVYVQEKRSDGVKPRRSVIMIDRLVNHLGRRQRNPEEPPNTKPQNIYMLSGFVISPPPFFLYGG